MHYIAIDNWTLDEKQIQSLLYHSVCMIHINALQRLEARATPLEGKNS